MQPANPAAMAYTHADQRIANLQARFNNAGTANDLALDAWLGSLNTNDHNAQTLAHAQLDLTLANLNQAAQALSDYRQHVLLAERAYIEHVQNLTESTKSSDKLQELISEWSGGDPEVANTLAEEYKKEIEDKFHAAALAFYNSVQ